MRLEGLNALTSFLKRLSSLARSISRTYARAVYLEAEIGFMVEDCLKS